MRKFYEVKKEHLKFALDTKLPTRGSQNAAGYDFYSKEKVTILPYETYLLWTDVKVQMEDDEVLFTFVRSGMGKKGITLSYSVGVVDADYFGNASNDGNIGFSLKNLSDKPFEIEIGDRIGQGVFTKYLVVENDSVVGKERKGGFGSTGK